MARTETRGVGATESVADFTCEEPFASMLGSHKGSMVVLADRYANRERDVVRASPVRA
jgi:hypothetical protein